MVEIELLVSWKTHNSQAVHTLEYGPLNELITVHMVTERYHKIRHMVYIIDFHLLLSFL